MSSAGAAGADSKSPWGKATEPLGPAGMVPAGALDGRDCAAAEGAAIGAAATAGANCASLLSNLDRFFVLLAGVCASFLSSLDLSFRSLDDMAGATGANLGTIETGDAVLVGSGIG